MSSPVLFRLSAIFRGWRITIGLPPLLEPAPTRSFRFFQGGPSAFSKPVTLFPVFFMTRDHPAFLLWAYPPQSHSMHPPVEIRNANVVLFSLRLFSPNLNRCFDSLVPRSFNTGIPKLNCFGMPQSGLLDRPLTRVAHPPPPISGPCSLASFSSSPLSS